MDKYMKNETLKLVLDYRVSEYRLLDEEQEIDVAWQLLIGQLLTNQEGYYETFIFDDGIQIPLVLRMDYRMKAAELLEDRRKKQYLNDLDATFAITHP